MGIIPSNLQHSATSFFVSDPTWRTSLKLVDDFRLFPTSYLRDELRLSWLKPWQEQNLPSMLGSLSGTG